MRSRSWICSSKAFTNSEIADTLYLSRPVIERHLTKILQKILPPK